MRYSVFLIIILSIIFVIISNLHITSNASHWSVSSAMTASAMSIIAMLLLPIITIKYLFREKPSHFGFRVPENFKTSLIYTFFGYFLSAIPLFFISKNIAFREFYAINDASLTRLVVVGVIFSLIYYFGEGFLFRGFLFWGLWNRVKWHSFWITSLIFALLHFEKPPMEIIFAFYASLIFCYVSLKTKSFAPAATLHFLLALSLNIVINYI